MQTEGGTISVAMCTYNGAKYLAEQLQSIANQTRLPQELIICDDRSTDATVEIIREFAARVPFTVNLVINPENLGSAKKGVTRNFEKASDLCNGDFVAMCDQDDIWFPQKLARLAAVLEQDASVGGVFSDAELINPQSQQTGTRMSQTSGLTEQEQQRLQQGEVLPVLLSMTKVYGCTLMMRANVLREILPVAPSWWFDAWLACMTAVHSKLQFVPEPLFCYRIHPSQQVGAVKRSLKQRIKEWRAPAAKYLEEAEPQLRELHERLEKDQRPEMKPHLEYLQGRMALLRMRATLPSNPLLRIGKVLPQAKNYRQYFNGWRSMVKDLTA
jgi:hypothetical protein